MAVVFFNYLEPRVAVQIPLSRRNELLYTCNFNKLARNLIFQVSARVTPMRHGHWKSEINASLLMYKRRKDPRLQKIWTESKCELEDLFPLFLVRGNKVVFLLSTDTPEYFLFFFFSLARNCIVRYFLKNFSAYSPAISSMSFFSYKFPS